MGSAIVKLLNRGFQGMHGAALFLALSTVFSIFLALIRDRLLAHTFGAGPELDIYYAAFKVPDLLFTIVASLVSLSVILPLLSEKDLRDRSEAERFVASNLTFFLAVMGVVALIAFALMGPITQFLFPGFGAAQLGVVTELSRFLLLQPILLGVSSLYQGVNQLHRKFIAYSASPILYNLGIIVGLISLYPRFGLIGLIYGVLLGAVAHVIIQLTAAFESGYHVQFVAPKWREIFEVVSISAPRTLALASGQLILVVLISLASGLSTGSITIFNFAYNLQSVPLSVIGVSYAIAAFPLLSDLFNKGQVSEFVKTVNTALRHVIFWSLPLTVLFIVLRAHIVRVVYGTGEFSWSDTRLTAAAFALFVLSAVAQSATNVLLRAFYAMGKTRLPVLISSIGAIFTMISASFLLEFYEASEKMRFFLESLLRIDDVPGSEVIMLPLAYSLGSIVTALWLWFAFRRVCPEPVSNEVRRSIDQIIAVAIVMGYVTYASLSFFQPVFDQTTFVGIFLQALSAGLTGIVIGGVLLHLTRNREYRFLSRSLGARVKRMLESKAQRD